MKRTTVAVLITFSLAFAGCETVKTWWGNPSTQAQIAQIEKAAFDAGYKFITEYIQSHLGKVRYGHLMITRKLTADERSRKGALAGELSAKHPKLSPSEVSAAVERGFDSGAHAAGQR